MDLTTDRLPYFAFFAYLHLEGFDFSLHCTKRTIFADFGQMSHGMRRRVVDDDGWILFSSVDGAIFVDVRRYPTRRRAMWGLPPVSAMDLS
uniref:DUF2185 domain-containing protein n=1 Tax=Angiostrongylus cantonensis TaxID=6313 RepID=A0A0K0CYA3_ANGCA